MSAELVTANIQQPLDLHAAIAEVLPQPEHKPADFPDTPLLASILNEQNLSYKPDQAEQLAAVAAEREATVSAMWHDTPLLMQVLERRPMVSPVEIAALAKAAQQAAAPAQETFVGWFTPGQRGNKRHFPFDIPPAPKNLPPTMRLSRLAVWQIVERGPIDVPEPHLPYSEALHNYPVKTILKAPAAPAKPASFVHTLRTKIASGWRRLTTRSAKSYVPAIPNW